MTDHISDKALWSAAKAWYIGLPDGNSVAWEALAPEQRVDIRNEYQAWLQHQPKSAHQLMAKLRKARIDNVILERKLAAANAKIAQLEASAALLNEMAQDAEPSCP